MKLVWFRSDFRTLDNPALSAAIKGSDKSIICVFAHPVSQLRGYGLGQRKIDFMISSAKQLEVRLLKQGIKVISVELNSFAEQAEFITQTCVDYGISEVYWNNEYPLDERNRDQKMVALLDKLSVRCHRFDGGIIVPPHSLTNLQGQVYKVFTPFKKAWLKRCESLTQCANNSGTAVLPPAVLDANEPNNEPFVSGEFAGLVQLKQFTDGAIFNYAHLRDFPNEVGTSSLSAHLSAGTVSPQVAYRQALFVKQQLEKDEDTDLRAEKLDAVNTWISQIVWREFYYHLVAQNDDICKGAAYQAYTDGIIWNQSEQFYDAWKQGKTGIPIVDAGMRQLNQTGWMHNRLRMVVAMFLSKNLFLNWRLGESYFLQQLVDADFALNNGGWQWSASTGTDAAPYFRIFNPFSQGQRFDPDARFIKRYVPELADLSYKIIHSEQKLAELRPSNYPAAIVNCKFTRQQAIEQFKAVR